PCPGASPPLNLLQRATKSSLAPGRARPAAEGFRPYPTRRFRSWVTRVCGAAHHCPAVARSGDRATTSGVGGRRRMSSLRLFRLLQPDQRPLLRAVLAEMHEHRRFGLRQVADARLVDRLLAVADGPRGALRLLVHGAEDGER